MQFLKRLVINGLSSRTSQNVAGAVVITQLILDLGERFAPDVPWQGTLAEVITYLVGLAIAAGMTSIIGRLGAEVRTPGKLG